MQSLYRRPLPAPLIAFGSAEGRRLFDEARAEGGMEAFFPLIEQFHTQAEPAFCGLGTLVVALNALGVDPGRLWRGPWRWFSEELLDCCTSLEAVRAQGITLDEFACLARCNGAQAEIHRPGEDAGAAFRAAVEEAARSSVAPAMIVSYARGALGQTGGGHFSPIGGYHRASDQALVLDVARFKYPPHWVPVPLLHAAMEPVDPVTGRSRGWVALRRGARPASLLFTARWVGEGGPEALVEAVASLRAGLGEAAVIDLGDALRRFFAAIERFPLEIDARAHAEGEHAAAAAALREALRGTAIFAEVAAAAPSTVGAEAATLLALALPGETWSTLPASVRARWRELVEAAALPELVGAEALYLRAQLEGLRGLGLGRGCGPACR